MEKMLVTQALDERDLLVKKITSKINNASFVTSIRHNEEKVKNGQVSRKEFEETAKSQYQQIQDLITRYQKIDAAIVNSNANTFIEVGGVSYSIAAAIALRSRLKEVSSDTDFELALGRKMQEEYNAVVKTIGIQNQKLEMTAADMRNSILGKDSKLKEDSPLEVVDTYVKENTYELVDPLGLKKKAEELAEGRDTTLRELDTKIKVSNATTMIEF